MLTESVETYLITIFLLTETAPRAKTGKIASRLGVHLSSVSEMLRRLEKTGYVIHETHRGTALTEYGQQIALNLIRKQRLLETFLFQMAKYALSEVHEEAQKMRHVISDRLADSLDAMLGYPQTDPHGHPIPSADGAMVSLDLLSLSDAAAGETAVIRRLDDRDSAKLQYLSELGLLPDMQVEVVEIAPFQGPVTVKINNETVVIANELAQKIGVEVGK